jgi:hypothetical protein
MMAPTMCFGDGWRPIALFHDFSVMLGHHALSHKLLVSSKRETTTVVAMLLHVRSNALHQSTRRAPQWMQHNMSIQRQTETPSNPFTWYSRQMDIHPLITNCLSGELVMGRGDAGYQYYRAEDREDFFTTKWNCKSTGALAFVQAFFLSPVRQYWYRDLMRQVSK